MLLTRLTYFWTCLSSTMFSVPITLSQETFFISFSMIIMTNDSIYLLKLVYIHNIVIMLVTLYKTRSILIGWLILLYIMLFIHYVNET